jgi:hypothetical protein
MRKNWKVSVVNIFWGTPILLGTSLSLRAHSQGSKSVGPKIREALGSRHSQA